ncbi:uncharacterized protein PAC_16994 [Phialocephala subalpina]|uniref:DUF6594 domain-containing protein n=1 Tax=Phialocephala subalpina TaxID=576137 RepID=A0A1L7XQ05_9HELO|nr:uncharacterized protein PAC_16994 [Phialocephala subalpina]
MSPDAEVDDLEAGIRVSVESFKGKPATEIKATNPNDTTTTAVGKDEPTRLFLYATVQRAAKNEIYEVGAASNLQIEKLRGLFNDQEWLEEDYTLELRSEVSGYFPDVMKSEEKKNPFDSETYRCLSQPPKQHEHGDPLRYFLCSHLSVRIKYSAEEKKLRKTDFDKEYPPITVSPRVELARFIIAMFGPISILVPMIIMSLNPSKTKSLITTSVATVFFACCCSLTLQTANDQTLAATAGHAAVLMVFVGLNS